MAREDGDTETARGPAAGRPLGGDNVVAAKPGDSRAHKRCCCDDNRPRITSALLTGTLLFLLVTQVRCAISHEYIFHLLCANTRRRDEHIQPNLEYFIVTMPDAAYTLNLNQ